MTDFSAQYRIEFAKRASLLLQQRGSKLRNHVMVGSHKGEGASPVDQYGAKVIFIVVNSFFVLLG